MAPRNSNLFSLYLFQTARIGYNVSIYIHFEVTMNQKVFKTLEYYKILDHLAVYASAAETKNRILNLIPSTDIDEINHLQETTKDALGRLYKSNNITFSGLHNINASLKRLSIGPTRCCSR